MKTLVNFLKDEKGLETVEWAVIAALIVVGIVAAVTTLGEHVKSTFETLRDNTEPPAAL